MTTPFEQRIEDVFADPLRSPAGVLHVASATESVGGELALLRIGPGTPTCATDGFVLELARARADAIVTTGQILRDEPTLRTQIGVDAASWRRERLCKPDPPLLLVLSSGRALPSRHPVFACGAGVVVYTNSEGAAELSRVGFANPPEIVWEREPSLRAAVAFLRRRGARSISIEAGASAVADLYTEPLGVDELLLSIFEGELPQARLAGSLPSLAQLRRCLPIEERAYEVREAEGLWRFARLRRAHSPST